MTPAAIYRAIATIALVGLTVLGATGGLHDIRSATEPLQRVQASSQLTYALGSLVTLALLWRRSPLLRWSLLAWAAAFCAAGTLAPVAWADAPWSTGLMAGLATLVVSGAVAWVALRASGTAAPAR